MQQSTVTLTLAVDGEHGAAAVSRAVETLVINGGGRLEVEVTSTTRSAPSSSSNPAPPKRKRGRPPKVKLGRPPKNPPPLGSELVPPPSVQKARRIKA